MHFGAETFRNGMDPLALLAYLDKLGSVLSVTHDRAAVPTLEQLDPETCHLAVELRLRGEVTQEQIESAFSFVRDDCQLQVRERGRYGASRSGLTSPAWTRARSIRGEMSQAHWRTADQVPRLGEMTTAGVSTWVTSAPKQQKRAPALRRPPRTSASFACRPTAWMR